MVNFLGAFLLCLCVRVCAWLLMSSCVVFVVYGRMWYGVCYVFFVCLCVRVCVCVSACA